MEDLEWFHRTVISPTIAEFEKQPNSVRLALLACVATFHGVDYLAHPDKSSTLRGSLRKESKAFEIVDYVAHAFKHVQTGDRANPKLKIQDVVGSSVTERMEKFDEEPFTIYPNEFAPSNGRVTLRTDETMDLLATVKETARFLLQRAGLPVAVASMPPPA
jgi:hypothetical protein